MRRRTRSTRRIPMGRMGEGEDIGAAVAYLASKRGGLRHRPDAARQRRHGDVLVALAVLSPANSGALPPDSRPCPLAAAPRVKDSASNSGAGGRFRPLARQGGHETTHEGHDRTRDAAALPVPRPVGGRTPQHHPDPVERADRGVGRRHASRSWRPTSTCRWSRRMAAVSVEAAGAITVSAHLLFDIARKLPDGSQVSLETADNRMTVKAGRSRFSLPTLPRDDFPVIVEGDLPTSFELPARDARRADRPHPLRDLDRGDALLPQRHLPPRLGRRQPVLKAAATDGHRLARFTLPRPEGAEGMPDVIVPRKCVARAAQAARGSARHQRRDRPVGLARSASRWAARTAWC